MAFDTFSSFSNQIGHYWMPLRLCSKNSNQLLVLNRLTDIFAVGKFDYGVMVSGRSRKFWWGGILSTKPQNSDVFTKIDSSYLAEIRNSNDFFAQNQVFSKKKKVFTKIESDFSAEIGNSNDFFAQIQVFSKKKKKEKGLNQN